MTFFRPLTFNSGYSDVIPDVNGFTSINYLRNSDVFTAVNVISNDIATDPIKLETNNVNRIADGKFNDLNYLLNIKPNEQMGARYFKYAMTANLLMNGNSYARIWQTEKEIIELQLLQPSWVQVMQEENSGAIYYEVNDGIHDPYQLQQKDVIHLRFFTTNGIIGRSPLYSLVDEMKLQKGGNKLLNDFFGSGLTGAGTLKMGKVGLDPAARTNIRNEWVKANGTKNDSRVIVLDTNEEYTPIEMDTSILKTINSNDYTTKQIAKAFQIPVSRLGLENAHTSLPQSNLDYIQNSLDHYFSLWTSELNIKLLTSREAKKYHFEFDTSRLMELDMETNMKLTLDYFKNGVIDDSETRQRIGMKPYDDDMSGKRVVISNYVPLENIQSNFPNNVLTGNAYDDTGKKPTGRQTLSKENKKLADEGGEKDGTKKSDDQTDPE